jgi:hypothetical protein
MIEMNDEEVINDLIESIEQEDSVTFDNKITWAEGEFSLNFLDFKKNELVTYKYENRILASTFRTKLED